MHVQHIDKMANLIADCITSYTPTNCTAEMLKEIHNGLETYWVDKVAVVYSREDIDDILENDYSISLEAISDGESLEILKKLYGDPNGSMHEDICRQTIKGEISTILTDKKIKKCSNCGGIKFNAGRVLIETVLIVGSKENAVVLQESVPVESGEICGPYVCTGCTESHAEYDDLIDFYEDISGS